MSNAWVLIRDQPHYRSQSFMDGLRRSGFGQVNLVTKVTGKMLKPDDVVVVWNAYGRYGDARKIADTVGCRTFVAENGYLGKDKNGRQYYALAEHGHTGSGRWRVGDDSRINALLASQKTALKPWREEGEHILICAQRGIGEPSMRSPYRWEEDVQKIIRETTDRPMKVRLHPGRHKTIGPLADDIKNAWACVVWTSNCTTDALLAGIPTFYAAPHIVHQGGALPLTGANLSNPQKGDRELSFRNMSWAQWSVTELEAGTPWKYLLPKTDPEGTHWIGGWKA